MKGGRGVQINGEGLIGMPTDNSPILTDSAEGTRFEADQLSGDESFLSSVARGQLHYILPALEHVYGTPGEKLQTVFKNIISVKGQGHIFECSNPDSCAVEYDAAFTPQVRRVFPATVYAGQDICFEVFTDQVSSGGKKVFTKAEIDGFLLDVTDSEPVTPSTGYDYTVCATVGETEANDNSKLEIFADVGKYSISSHALSYEENESYVVRTIPTIKLLQSNTLFKAGGARVEIKGLGFSENEADNTVTFDDLTCEVLSSSNTHIICELPEKTEDTSAPYYVGGTGARAKVYVGSKNTINEDTHTPLRDEYFTDLDAKRDTLSDQTTRIIETFFVPP
jgi:hypothetical protein